MPDPAVTEDALLGGRVRLLQRSGGHRAGTDAVLLAASVLTRAGQVVTDVGAGTGAVGLMVSARLSGIRLVLVERDPGLAELCRQNLALNGSEGSVVEADILDSQARRDAGLAAEMADVVLTNPPFLEEGSARLSPDTGRAGAHALPAGGLEAWLGACITLLRPGGTLALIHRADRLAECLALIAPKLGGLRLRLVHPRAEEAASRLLLSGIKGSKAPLRVEPPLVLHDAAGRFTPVAEAIHRGEAALV